MAIFAHAFQLCTPLTNFICWLTVLVHSLRNVPPAARQRFEPQGVQNTIATRSHFALFSLTVTVAALTSR